MAASRSTSRRRDRSLRRPARHRSGAGVRRRICRCTSPTARRDDRGAAKRPSRIHNNCSGKHAGMLAHCVQQQWVTNGYHRADRTRCSSACSRRWRGGCASTPRSIEQAIDGCGLPTFATAARCGGRRLREVRRRGRRRRCRRRPRSSTRWSRIRNSSPAPIASTPT